MPSSISTDVLILSCPWTVTGQPMSAGAVLKSIANNAGYSCATADLNAISIRWVQANPQFDGLISYFLNGSKDHITQEHIDKFASLVIEIVANHQPRLLGLSVFSDHSRVATKLIAQTVRQHFPNIKIIIGGAGIANPYADNSFNHPVAVSGQLSFAEKLLQDNLIDHYIHGDAEHAFLEFLKGHFNSTGIDQHSWRQLTNNELLDLPYPDYSDYDWSLYEHRTLGITGSRGCVRQCNFCDYIFTHKKYTWRPGEHIFNEMLYQKQLYNISAFHFSDSLLNGNIVEYRKLVTLLAEYNAVHPDDPFRWGSFLIIKSSAQFDDELWRLTAASGCEYAWIGLETYVEKLRFDMNKKFTNQDVEFCLEKIVKYHIHVTFLVFVGYPTETQQDIEESIKWLEDHQHLNKNFSLFFNETMSLMTGSWIEQNKHVYQIKLIDPTDGNTWVSPESTLELRKQRSRLLRGTAISLGYTIITQDDGHDPHRQIEENLTNILESNKAPKV